MDGKVTVEITFQVSFIKSTYMKYIIERSTNAEMTMWLEAFFQNLRKTCDNLRNGTISLEPGSTATAETGSNSATETAAAESVASVAAAVVQTVDASSARSKEKHPELTSPFRESFLLILVLILTVLVVWNLLQLWSLKAQMKELDGRVSSLESRFSHLSHSR